MDTMTTTPIVDQSICHGYELPLLSFVFGEMLALAWPVLEAFRGDLFHDALTINDALYNGGTVYWAVRSSGTDLALSAEDLPTPANGYYRIDVFQEPTTTTTWRLRITRYEP